MTQPEARVLIIDDDDEVLAFVRDALVEHGFEVFTCESGQHALDWFKKNEPPCIILLDLVMPEMDGWALWQESRYFRHIRDVPVIVLTGDPRMQRMAQLTGVAGFVHKPLKVDDLVEAIRSALVRRGPGSKGGPGGKTSIDRTMPY